MAKRASKVAEVAEDDVEVRGPGRPAGSQNRDYVAGNDVTSACPKCGGTDSVSERATRVNEQLEIIRVRCTNPDCGQWRFDRRTIK